MNGIWVCGKTKLAKHLDVSVPTINLLVSQGLPEYKIGLRTHHYRTDEADEFMKRYLTEHEKPLEDWCANIMEMFK